MIYTRPFGFCLLCDGELLLPLFLLLEGGEGGAQQPRRQHEEQPQQRQRRRQRLQHCSQDSQILTPVGNWSKPGHYGRVLTW